MMLPVQVVNGHPLDVHYNCVALDLRIVFGEPLHSYGFLENLSRNQILFCPISHQRFRGPLVNCHAAPLDCTAFGSYSLIAAPTYSRMENSKPLDRPFIEISVLGIKTQVGSNEFMHYHPLQM